MRWFGILLLLGLARAAIAEEPADSADVVPPAPDRKASETFSLESCISLALVNHPRLVEFDARVGEAQGQAFQAGLYPNPRIDSGNPQTIGTNRTGIYTIGLTQEVVRGGKLKLDRAAATQSVHQAEWESLQKRFEVLTTVRQEFFSTLAAQRRKKLFDRLLELTKRSEKASTDLLAAGQVSKTDVLSLRVERRKAETALQGAEIALVGQRRQLAASIGIPASSIVEVDGNLTSSVPAFDDEAVLTAVLANSPLVQMADREIDRSMLLLKRAEVEPIQNVFVQAGTQYQEATANYQALVMLYVNIPIWDRNQGNIMAANSTVRRSIANRQAALQDLTKRIADAITRFHVAEQTVKNYEEGILPDASESLQLVQDAYARGQFDISRLVQTQRTVFEANIDFIAALENRLSAAAEIAGYLMMDEFP